jgi:8-oxo-dGTP pyrophosphatase MutT (NUDIX family)
MRSSCRTVDTPHWRWFTIPVALPSSRSTTCSRYAFCVSTAGKLEPAEPPEVTARRELTEEAGVVATDWVSLGSLLSSPGVFSEVIHLYLAQGLSAARSQLEDSEVLEVHWVSFRQACDMALSGELRDAKTTIGVLRAAHRLGLSLTPG